MLKSLPASISRTILSGTAKHAEAQAAADRLAAVMAEIHGGNWRVNINHQRAVVMIWQNGNDAVEDRR